MNDEKFTLLIPSEEYEDELRMITEDFGGDFDDEPESHIAATMVCSLTFGLTAAIAAVAQVILQYKSMKNERVILVTPKNVFRNITLEQAQEILKEYVTAV